MIMMIRWNYNWIKLFPFSFELSFQPHFSCTDPSISDCFPNNTHNFKVTFLMLYQPIYIYVFLSLFLSSMPSIIGVLKFNKKISNLHQLIQIHFISSSSPLVLARTRKAWVAIMDYDSAALLVFVFFPNLLPGAFNNLWDLLFFFFFFFLAISPLCFHL